MKFRFTAVATAIATCLAASAANAVIYDPAIDFESGFTTKSNANGVWSYGYSSTPTSAITLYDSQTTGADSANQQMWISSAINCCVASPSVGYNNGLAFNDGNVGQAADQIDMVSSVSQGVSDDLVFTAPSTGEYALTSSFIGDQYGIGVDVSVVKNGSVIFSSTVTSFGQVVPYNTSFSLDKGDTVEFAVQQGGGDQNTGLDVSLSTAAVPEPAVWALMVVGFGLLGARVRGAFRARGATL